MSGRRSRYTDEFKADAVSLVVENGYNCAEAARRLGVNAPTERFFRSLKTERFDGLRFSTRDSARLEIIDYISYYNCLRLHSTLGYVSPMAYEKGQIREAA